MSSTAYSAEIIPNPVLRRLVVVSGVCLCIAGLLAILTLPLHPWARLGVALGWIVLAVVELRQLRRAWRNCRRFRFHAGGEIQLLGSDGHWRAGCLVSGGVLLGKVGWMRLRDPAGLTFGELIAGDPRSSHDWRRLQVIWRHVGA